MIPSYGGIARAEGSSSSGHVTCVGRLTALRWGRSCSPCHRSSVPFALSYFPVLELVTSLVLPRKRSSSRYPHHLSPLPRLALHRLQRSLHLPPPPPAVRAARAINNITWNTQSLHNVMQFMNMVIGDKFFDPMLVKESWAIKR